MNVIKTLALGAGMAGLLLSTAYAEGLQGKVIGFSQIGSESGWRAAETSVTKAVAAELGIDLKFADAQQKQENQIKAIRGFIAQGVDAILVATAVLQSRLSRRARAALVAHAAFVACALVRARYVD